MKALFTTIEEIQEYITIDISSNFRTIAPYVKQAEKFTTDIIGKALHKKLLEVVHQNNDDEALKDLLTEVRLPLANFAYSLAIAKLNVNVGETGFTVTVGNNLEPASKWRIDEFRESVNSAGNDALEILIEFLEDNVEAYPLWKTSKAYSFQKQFFVNNAKEINDSVFLEISRIEFLKLKQNIHIIEQAEIKAAICSRFFNQLKSEIKTGNISNDNQLILNSYIRPALCYLALDNSKNNDNYKLEGKRYLEQLMNYLNTNADKYPDYKLSDCYTDTTELTTEINDEENGFFVMG